MSDTVEARPVAGSDAWAVRIAVGTPIPDLCYRLARALPGVMRLVDARSDGSDMVTLIFIPDGVSSKFTAGGQS